MRRQQQIWLKEHVSSSTLPDMANTEPAAGVVQFIDYLRAHAIPLRGRAVDIGAGQGRNSVMLAETGFDVWAFEYIEPAIAIAKKLAKSRDVGDKIYFEVIDVAQTWRIGDNFFDVAIDYFTSINIETKRGREIYRDEIFRTLKPGGYALVTVSSIDDEWEKELIANHPGAEPNSSLWPQTGKFQKSYNEAELCDFYRAFEIDELRIIKKTVLKLGRQGRTTYFWVVLRKPL